jgi:hypothetical protein
MYPEFSDIKCQKFNGFDPSVVYAEVEAWIALHPTYRFIACVTDTVDGVGTGQLGRIHTANPEVNMWFEIMLIYTE